jgi:deoxycytidylate deaminase
MNISHKFVKLAIDEANKSDYKQKIGCIIFDKKIVLSRGYNTPQKSVKKLHPKFQGFPFSVHAEVDAIIKARKDLKGSSILVVRVNRFNQLRLSKPCKNCMKYIQHVGIKNIFYSIDRYPYIKQLI